MKSFRKFISAVLAIVTVGVCALSGCVGQEMPAEGRATEQLYLGNICTMDESRPFAEAVTVVDGKPVYTADTSGAEPFSFEDFLYAWYYIAKYDWNDLGW